MPTRIKRKRKKPESANARPQWSIQISAEDKENRGGIHAMLRCMHESREFVLRRVVEYGKTCGSDITQIAMIYECYFMLVAVREDDQPGLQFIRDTYSCGWDSMGILAINNQMNSAEAVLFEEYEGSLVIQRYFTAVCRASSPRRDFFAQVFELRDGVPILVALYDHAKNGQIEKIDLDDIDLKDEETTNER